MAASFFLILLQIQGFSRQNALFMMKREAYDGEQTKPWRENGGRGGIVHSAMVDFFVSSACDRAC
jgi:hypothetical protein